MWGEGVPQSGDCENGVSGSGCGGKGVPQSGDCENGVSGSGCGGKGDWARRKMIETRMLQWNSE